MPADSLASGSPRRQGRRPTPPESIVSRGRAGDRARRGRAAGPDGPFVLADGLAAPGAVRLTAAVEQVAAELTRQAAAGTIGKDSAYQAARCAQQFASYAAARGVVLLADVGHDEVEMFVHAPHARVPGSVESSAVGTKHSRRSALRLMFKTCRALGLDDRDPAADIVLPPRQERVARPLTDDEMQRCQDASFRTTTETRLPCALALAMSGAMPSEAMAMTVEDVWPEHRRALAHDGPNLAPARWLELGDWAAEQIARRVDDLARTPPRWSYVPLDRPRGLVYVPRVADERRVRKQRTSDAVLLVLRLAGLDDPEIRPTSVLEWFAAKVYERTGSVEHVAARLGLVSLDAAASILGLDWRGLYDLDGPPGVALPPAPGERGIR